MSNLPLRDLVWKDAAISSEAQHEFFNYRVIPDHDSVDKFAVRYKDSDHRPATGFATMEEAKEWAWGNYNEKMQPYVVPDFISINEKLPEQNTNVLVLYHAHFEDEEITEFDICTAFFRNESFDVKDQNFYTRRKIKVVGWKSIDAAAAFKAMRKPLVKQGE